MSHLESVSAPSRQAASMASYYRFHAKIYDATRWSFLFGRTRVLKLVVKRMKPKRILEIGCGTGRNLVWLRSAFPEASITGLDVSQDMLDKASERLDGSEVDLVHMPYESPLSEPGRRFDLILVSYCLSMINPGWETVIDSAARDLSPNGLLAVVDFNHSKFNLFKRWMAVNHVRMDGHLPPALAAACDVELEERRPAYLCLWEYVLFLGRRK